MSLTGSGPREAVRLREQHNEVPWGHELPWKIGVRAAEAMREQEGLGLQPLSDQRLCELGAVCEDALSPDEAEKNVVAFMLDGPAHTAKVVLRSGNKPGRRFELARLLGDRAMVDQGRLFPATATSSYRQKVQRAFAAELLCPWEAARPMIEDMVSEDDATDVANHFGVSTRLVLNRAEDYLQQGQMLSGGRRSLP